MSALLESIRECKLRETASDTTPRVDTKRGIIHGVKVLGAKSKSTGKTIGLDPAEFGEAVNEPYVYSKRAMLEAAPLYEGAKVYIDHPEFSYKQDGERVASTRDRKTGEVFGQLHNIRVTESGMFADLHFLKTHSLAAQIVETAQRMPSLLALSHNATGHPSLVNGRIVIEKITDVRSVDLVGERPGTTHSLFETEGKPMSTLVATRGARGVDLDERDARRQAKLLEAGGNDVMGSLDPVIGKQTTDFEHLVDPNYQPGTKALTEDDGMGAMGGEGGEAPMPEDTPPPPDDAPPADGAATGDHFDNAFKTEINSILDGPGDEDEMADKIKALLEHRKGIKEIRTGSHGDEPPSDGSVGADMEETDPDKAGEKDEKEEKEDEPPFKESAPPKGMGSVKPCETGKVVKAVETAPVKPVPAKAPVLQSNTRAKLARELIETVFTPCIDLLNAHKQPVTSAMLMATALMPAKRREAFVASLAPAQNIAPRSQAGAVGVRETSPNAGQRPAKPGQKPAPTATKKIAVSETDPKKLLSFARGAVPLLD